ncbi:sensor domain-containing protein [Nonomuraea sp. NPDC050310]|uniref:sensor histidine kinase n=1 Tax=unclassified Nonomuraea TaxID=2593643 RepID=UPI0033F200D1
MATSVIRFVGGPWGPVGLARDPMTWRAAPYLLLSPLLGLGWFVVLAFLLPTSLILMIFWVGVLLLVATMFLWRGGAMLERRLLRLTLGVRIADPYRPQPERGLIRWLVTDPATWKDLGYLLLLIPLSFVEFVASLLLWLTTFALLGAPLFLLLGTPVQLAGFELDSLPLSLVAVLLGLVMFALTLYGVRGMAWLHGLLAVALLGGNEAERLRASRARGVDAAEAERRRIERDLHDGAQQRLLAVAVDLGRARAKLDTDPDAARELIVQAHDGTKAAIAELRNLARGIHPAILTERGLDAALSALAARAPVPVDVGVELRARPPAAVESIAYFTVAEALANLAKHAAATEASVRVHGDGSAVFVEVWDNGLGGATVHPGGGLAGLADRAATIDGLLVLHSPVGGPTLVRAELPCEY